jgi:putative ABC transport system permease protein
MLNDLLLRMRSLFRRKIVEAEMDEELRFHFENQVAKLVRSGLTPTEAKRRARLEFGGMEQVKEDYRDSRGVTFIETLLQDIRYGVRSLRKNPGFAAIAVLTLALAVGANTAIFSVVDTVLLRPLPFKDPARLVWATEHFAFGPSTVVSADFPAWKDRNHVFEQIGAFGGTSGANLTGAGEPSRVTVTKVTTGLFSMLGVQPVAGRTFLADEAKQDQEHVALLNETLWRNRFRADPRIIGGAIRLDGAGYIVVGVMPASVRPQADLWTPLALDAEIFSPHSPRWMMLAAVGRLKPGIEMSQAQSDLQVITHQMDKEYPPQAAQFRAHETVEVIPLHELLVQNVRSLLLILLGTVGFVLLIACANVANLLLSRSIVRGREIAVRAALGAGRLRLVRQLLTEGLLLATIGGVLGSITGLWATKILRQLIPASLPADVRLDPRIFGFSAVIITLALFLFGLIPALIASRTDVNETLKDGGLRLGVSPGTHRLRGLMSAGEIALSLILLVGAGLLLRSFLRLTEVALGFDPNGLLIATVERPLTAAFDSQQHSAFFQASLERIRKLPGVQEAALTQRYPLGPPHNATMMLRVQGAENFRPPQPISVTEISPDYFHVMRIRLLKGRTFSDRDVASAQGATIINESLARMVFGMREPVGQHISSSPPPAPWSEVVGVVADMRDNAIEEGPAPEIFVPYLQQPSFSMTFVLRTASNPQMLAGAVREAVQSIDRNQPLSDTTTMDEVIAKSVAPRRFRMLLLGLFALLALLLAVIGVYGVIAYSSSQRTHEFGVRIALGADRRDILNLVVRQGFKLALLGVSSGVIGALILTRFLSSLLYKVSPHDPLTFAGVATLLMIVALAASYIPARRAMRVDPMVALRYS